MATLTHEPIRTVDALMDVMSRPTPEVEQAVQALKGDILILGIAGKMGPSLGRLLVRAGARSVIGVSRFSNPADRDTIDALGVKTITCDLLDEEGLRQLPDSDHIILMAGHKFGSTGNEPLTWAMNTWLPACVMHRYPESRIVYVSSGNVYRFTSVTGRGAAESDPVDPIGEYAQSRLGGERLVQHLARANGTPVAIIRLFYATELRYGIILDIAQKVAARKPIDIAMGHVNQIWQGDANAYLARCFPFCESPARLLNLTGLDVLSVRLLAEQVGRQLGIEPILEGEEADTALLGDSRELASLLGPPRISPDQIVDWVTWWVANGGATLGKPTKYESRTGKF